MVLPVIMLLALGASAFVNNTPVVVVLIPVVLALTQRMGLASSHYLLPLSYAAILGGSCTLIGTSTNLLVGGVAREAGLAPFGIFEIAPLGIAVALIGSVYMSLSARFLPHRETLSGRTTRYCLDTLVLRPSDRLILELEIGELLTLKAEGP